MRKLFIINICILSLAFLTGYDYLEEVKKPHESSLSSAVRKESVDSVKTLVYVGVETNHKTTTGQTPLTIAAKKGNVEIVELLVEVGGANTNLRGPNGITPLMYASKYGYFDITQYLLNKGANEKALDVKGKSALLYAVENNQLDIAKLLVDMNPALLDFPDDNGYTPIIFAVKNGNLKFMEFLASKNVNINKYSI